MQPFLDIIIIIMLSLDGSTRYQPRSMLTVPPVLCFILRFVDYRRFIIINTVLSGICFYLYSEFDLISPSTAVVT